MATLDKQSVRAEFDKIKASFQEQVAAGKVSTEVATLVNTLMMLFNIILSIFMEKSTKKTSANSGIPPSQTSPDDTSLTTKSKKDEEKDKQKTITVVGNTRKVETVTLLPVLSCEACGENLSNVTCECVERRTKIDIIFEKTEEHVDAEVKQCPACNTTVKAKFPDDMPGSLQYGNGIKAYVIQLIVAQMIALKRVSDMVTALIGRTLSEATLLGYVRRLHLALESWENHAKTQLMAAQCIHTDETSLRVDKKNHWIHVYSAGDITLKFLHEKRGKEAMDDIGIIPQYKGTIVHDCWGSYLSYDHLNHGLCGSHLLRELTFIMDSNGYLWAKKMKRLLQKTCKIVSSRKEKCLTANEYLKLQRLYRKILSVGEQELPAIPKKTTKRRGRVAKSDAHNLWERLKKYEASVLLFAKLPYVSFTNNRAERDLRMTKVKQKVSGCFRTEKYARAYCRISSYLQTMRNKGINPMVAVSIALNDRVDF
ncbi:MAG: IS66 family transposase [Gammaproteobacteria bacterium]|nr:IS66 family transposase [Gammaproteobacteria bacterium]